MRTWDSRLAKIMRPRGKTCVPIRVILRFRGLCLYCNAYYNFSHLIPTSKVHLTERMIADHMKELSLNNIAWSPAGNNSMLEGMYREDDS